MKILSKIFYIIAFLLNEAMIGVVFYNYGMMEMGIKYAGYSAPANVSYFLAIPFLIGIIICLILGYICGRKEKKSDGNEEVSN